MAKHVLPFIAVVLAYESFRSKADQLNSHVNFTFMPRFDNWLFGNLPIAVFQDWLWRGHVRWYDFVFYLAYMLHFILPLCLAILIWKTRAAHYWRTVWTYLSVAFAAFLTYLVFPAAPPWMAADEHVIQPMHRISSDVWWALGLHDFPSFYNHISPNEVAAVPSLHAAWATLLAVFIYKLYGRRWGLVATLYPLLIYVGTIYQGEHYAFDVLAGIAYALAGYWLTPYLMRFAISLYGKAKKAYSSSTKSASRPRLK